MDSLDLLDIVKPLEQLLKEINPRTIYTHHYGDLNVDHRKLHEAACTVSRPQPGIEQNLLFFEVPSATGWLPTGDASGYFIPSLYNDITLYLDKKIEALEVYREEMRPYPHARSFEAVRHLAHMRGSHVGLHAAEAFSVGRIINL
jgi:LmbE family N-acetylglucosaminyl deacetylase